MTRMYTVHTLTYNAHNPNTHSQTYTVNPCTTYVWNTQARASQKVPHRGLATLQKV